MKKKNVFVLISFVSVALSCSVAFVSTKIGKGFRVVKADCPHTHVEHYKVYPTTTDVGRIEHWACCECGTAWYDAAKTQEVLDRNDLNIPVSTEVSEVDKREVQVDDILTIYDQGDKTKCLDQTNWGESNTPKSTGTYKYYEVDGRRALKVSAVELTDAQRELIYNGANSGFSEWRFAKTVSTNKVTFDYKYWDVNTQNYSDGTINAHCGAQFYAGGYNNASMDLINDNAWHSMTVTADQVYNITYFVMKIYHFEGVLYISNLVIGDAPAVDFTVSRSGATLYNVSSSVDVSDWGGGYNGGNKVNCFGTNSIAYAYYAMSTFEARLPRIDYRKYSEVTFDLENVEVTSGASIVNTWEFRLGFDTTNWVQYAGADATKVPVTGGKLTIMPFAGKLVARITSFAGITNLRAEITDTDIIRGYKPFVLYLSSGCGGSDSFALIVKNLTFQTENGLYGLSKVAECAGDTSFANTDFTPNVFGFKNLYNRVGIAYGQNFFLNNVNLDQYDTLVFGVHIEGSDNDTSYAYFFSGGSDAAIVWNNGYGVMKLQKNASGKWDSFTKEYHLLNGAWTAKIGNLEKSNLNAFTVVNWATGGDETVKIGLTELYAK